MKDLGHYKIEKYLESTYPGFSSWAYKDSNKFYAIKFIDKATAKVRFKTGRYIAVKYLYNEGIVKEYEIEPESLYDVLESEKEDRKIVELNKTELQYLNYFRALTGKQQIELLNRLSDVLIEYVTKRHDK
jgi:hypothetical protein